MTGQTEDQQVSHQHCPLRVLILEMGQPIINVKRFSRFSSNNYVMKHNGAILNQLYLHVSYYRILRRKLETFQDVLTIAMCFCISTLLTLVNVYVDLLVFTRIAGTSQTGSGRFWC